MFHSPDRMLCHYVNSIYAWWKWAQNLFCIHVKYIYMLSLSLPLPFLFLIYFFFCCCSHCNPKNRHNLPAFTATQYDMWFTQTYRVAYTFHTIDSSQIVNCFAIAIVAVKDIMITVLINFVWHSWQKMEKHQYR